ncbi:hypothetical protein HYPSUDRAFT_633993 [Hypholoma sublateritium FD-334 SS-4]|uniref:Uncharacterized protein n=1 Tax=Hypholoma sublateritium (strain FD-334 SS-4) TaxID=945553 RepID=A0A0D2PDV3_HYPSF|nr:hypothetical protein HYPSUDRAFT_633993 [Hypholoma sublateritium FD-334 SS-4]
MHAKEENLSIANDSDVILIHSPVDISKVEASDTVQSYLSTSNSSKRTRLSANLDAGTCGRSGHLVSADTTLPTTYSHPVRRDFLDCLWGLFTWLVPLTPGRNSQRWDRSCLTATLKFLLLLYCGFSCVVGTTGFYSRILRPVSTPTLTGLQEKDYANSRTMERYLTRSLVPSTLRLEPFVFSRSNQANDSVTICTWLTDMELHLLPTWSVNWHDFMSLVVVTAIMPASPSHADLLKVIQQSIPPRLIAGTSVHILHIGDNHIKSPNLYLNLAKTFASTEWILIYPGDFSRPLSRKISDAIPRERGDSGVYIFAANTDGYPFPALSPLLLQSKRDFWCTERHFSGVSRDFDWNECLWQVSLETTGNFDVVNMPAEIARQEEIAPAEQ